MTMRPLLLALLGLAACAGASAQSIEATRYVGAGGVEIIQNRSAPRVDAGAVPAPAAAATATAATAASARALQVSPAQQQARDKDRLAILEHELLAEAARYEKQSHTLQSPSARARLSEEEQARLQLELRASEQNIRSLNTEIGRVKRSR